MFFCVKNNSLSDDSNFCIYYMPKEMKKLYYLSTCDTCKRIINELNLPSDVILQDIKSTEITVGQLEEMYVLSESYEGLFSKRAKLYKEKDLKNANLAEADYKKYILEHYTFLIRPVLLYNDQIFIGNSKKTIAVKQRYFLYFLKSFGFTSNRENLA